MHCTEWRVGFHLGRYGGVTSEEIGERGGIDRRRVISAIAALGGKRFLTSAKLPNHRYHRLFFVTLLILWVILRLLQQKSLWQFFVTLRHTFRWHALISLPW